MPADPEETNNTRQVEKACFSYVDPKHVPAPQLIVYSQELAEELGLSQSYCESDEFIQVVSGNAKRSDMKPYAMCYGGHQFGNWAGQLGDGRAINLGEVRDQSQHLQTVQLKGAGPTPYSRSADGLAVLRSSIREFLCSEAMHHLGIPTTRALSLSLSGEGVERDMFYSGQPEIEPGAIVARVSPSFIRFGSFEIFSARGDIETLDTLLAYTIENNFPELYDQYLSDKKSAVLAFLREVSERTCEMIVHWMRVGFVHGVMNTDNMSILGLTIDYGPYGWLDNFDPTWTPNTTDSQHKRYRYENQASVAQWNLLQLANALYPLVESAPELETIVRNFKTSYEMRWHDMMSQKLGIETQQEHYESQHELFTQLEQMLAGCEFDMTLFYRFLTDECHGYSKQEDAATKERCLNELSYKDKLNANELKEWNDWIQEYERHISLTDLSSAQRLEIMNKNNPVFILRNFVAQEAIEQANKGDYTLVKQLLEAVSHPYSDHSSHVGFEKKRPEWAMNKAGCSMLSCSS